MSNFERAPENPHLKKLKETIESSPAEMEREFASFSESEGGNDWLACFASRIQALELYMLDVKDDSTIPEDHFGKLRQRLDELKKYFFELRTRYPKAAENIKKGFPSKDEKDVLMARLNILEGND